MKRYLISFLFLFAAVGKAEDQMLAIKVGRLEAQVAALSEKVEKLRAELDNLTAQNSKNFYFCELSVFTKTYKAFGATELVAKEKVKDLCAEGNNGSDFHCKNPTCRKNE